MREPIRDRARLEHILTAINRIQLFVKDRSEDEVKKDGILYFAVVKNIEIIGEASYMLSKEFKNSHNETPWQIIVGMRHFLVHGYFEVDPDEVWNVVEKQLTPLKEQIERYLEEKKEEEKKEKQEEQERKEEK